MNAYELRMNCLEMAERQLHNQQEFSTDALFTHAKQLYDFVQHGHHELDKNGAIPKSWVNPEDFIEKLSVLHPVKGSMLFTPYDFQKDIIKNINDNDHIIINAARQMGMTTTIAYYLIWYAHKHSNKNILIVGDKRSGITSEINNRMDFTMVHSDVIDESSIHRTKRCMKFANDSTITFGTLNDLNPDDYDVVWIDNTAFISPNKTKGLEATLTKFEKVILSSTPYKKNGLFYDLWISDSSSWTTEVVHWSMHPDRDEQWANETSAYIGEDMFAREHENCFD